jgi:polyhydroxybutyrate depolymerase
MRSLGMLLVLLVACGDDSGAGADGGGGSGAATSNGGQNSGAGSSTGGAGAGGSANGGSANGGSASGGSAAGGASGCIDDTSATERRVVNCGPLSYDVAIPEDCPAQGCGLIFDVHGLTMSGEMQEANTGLAQRGREAGYVVVQPNATPAPPAASWAAAEDDDDVFAFLEEAIAGYSIDPKRVHFTGFSQGGDMTWRMLCNHSEVFASVAPAAFGLSQDEQCFRTGTAPAATVPILFMHGQFDSLVPFAQALAARDAVIGVLDLSLVGEVDFLGGAPPPGGPKRTRFSGEGNALLEFVEHGYGGVSTLGGHCYPGSEDPGTAQGQLFTFRCNPPNAFNWGAEVRSLLASSDAS